MDRKRQSLVFPKQKPSIISTFFLFPPSEREYPSKSVNDNALKAKDYAIRNFPFLDHVRNDRFK